MKKQYDYFQTEDVRANLRTRAVRGGTVTLLGQFGRFVTQMGGTMILARLLTPGDYGLVAMVSAFLRFIEIFKDLGLSAATIQRPKINHGQVSTLFWINAGLGLLMTLLAIAISPLIAGFYDESALIPIACTFGVSFTLNGLTIQHQALLRRQLQFFRLALIDYLAIFFSVGIAIIMAYRGFGYWALVSQPITGTLTSLIGVWVACHWRPGPPVRHSGVRQMLAFGGNLTGFSVVNYFARNADKVLIGWAWGQSTLGLYDKAYQLFLLPIRQLNTPLSAVAIPTLSRLMEDPQTYRRTYLRVIEKIVMLTMPGIAVMIVTADWLILIVLGSQWVEAASIFMLLAIAGFTQPVSNANGWLFTSQDRTGEKLRLVLVTGSLIVLSIIIGLPYGAEGVAASYAVIVILIVTPLQYYVVGRKGPVSTWDIYRTILPSCLISIIVALSLYLLRTYVDIEKPVVGVLAAGICGAVVTLALFFLLPSGRAGLRDFKQTLKMLRR